MSTKDLLKHFVFYINAQSGRETFVMKVSPDEHITLQLRHRERIIDIHKTKELEGGEKSYETLFRLSFYRFYRILLSISRTVEDLQASVKTLEDARREFPFMIKNPGWFRRHFMVAMPMDLNHMTDIGLLRIQKKGRRFKFGKDIHGIDPDHIIMPIDEHLKAGQYLVFRWNKKLSLVQSGHLYVVKTPKRVFLFMPKQTINKSMKRFAAPLVREMMRMEHAQDSTGLTELRQRYPRMPLSVVA